MKLNRNENIARWLKKSFLVLFLAILLPSGVRGQNIKLPNKEMSVSEIINSVQGQTEYVFALDRATFDVTRMVTVEQGEYSIEDVAEFILRDTPFSYMIYSSYVVIDSTPKKQTENSVPIVSRTGDVYTPGASDVNEVFSEIIKQYKPKERPPVQIQKADPKIHELNTVKPYSAYSVPSDYLPEQKKLSRTVLKTNLLYGAVALAPNLAAEFGLKENRTLEVSVSYNGWERKWEESSQLNHLIIRPEYRWWMCERFNGHFVGANVMFARYHIGGKKVPMLFKKHERYDGYAYGAGITYGYNLPLSKRWGLEFNVGVGASYLTYDRYTCEVCDIEAIKTNKFYVGLTRVGASLVFTIK